MFNSWVVTVLIGIGTFLFIFRHFIGALLDRLEKNREKVTSINKKYDAYVRSEVKKWKLFGNICTLIEEVEYKPERPGKIANYLKTAQELAFVIASLAQKDRNLWPTIEWATVTQKKGTDGSFFISYTPKRKIVFPKQHHQYFEGCLRNYTNNTLELHECSFDKSDPRIIKNLIIREE